MMKRLLSIVLALTVLTLLPGQILAASLEQIPGDTQGQFLTRQFEDWAKRLRMSDPDYDAKLLEAMETAALLFQQKAQQDAALNSREIPLAARGCQIQGAVPWGSLLLGDVMHINNKKFFNLYAMYYSHSGTYNGSNTVYESNSDGVRIRPLSSWQQGQPVALGYTRGKNLSEVTTALNWAKTKYGTDGRTPYNWNFLNKNTDSSLYCSQLVWKIHQKMGVEVDSNHWSYVAYLTAKFGLVGTTFALSAVAPDEVFLSNNVIYYHAN